MRSYLTDTKGISGELVDSLYQLGHLTEASHGTEPALAFAYRSMSGALAGREILGLSSGKNEVPALENAWFYIGDLTKAATVVAVPSAIDAMSYQCLRGSDDKVVVSCPRNEISADLLLHSHLRRQSFVVAFNKTTAGESTWQKTWDETADWGGFSLSSEVPVNRSWNDDLLVRQAPTQSRSIKL